MAVLLKRPCIGHLSFRNICTLHIVMKQRCESLIEQICLCGRLERPVGLFNLHHIITLQSLLQMREIDKSKGSKRKGIRGDNEGDDVGDRIKFKRKY